MTDWTPDPKKAPPDNISSLEMGVTALRRFNEEYLESECGPGDLLLLAQNYFLAAIAEALNLTESEKEKQAGARQHQKTLRYYEQKEAKLEKARKVTCPTCHARPDEDCYTSDGKAYQRLQLHKPREYLAAGG